MAANNKKTNWTVSDIPSQQGRSIIITGIAGLAYEDALALVRAGADVILAGRNPAKGAEAVNNIRAAVPGAKIRFEVLDLASLASIKEFGKRLRSERQSLDILINNAGVMAPPQRKTTTDGFELQFGTNYLGHFALTAELLPLLRQAKEPRVINVSSVAARNGEINFDDLQAERQYKPTAVYAQSKLANLLFSLELQRRSEANGWGLRSIAAHPGISRTNLIPSGMGPNSMMNRISHVIGPIFMQSAARGALPTLYAATSPEARASGYYGPDGMGEIRGKPAPAKLPARAHDAEVAARLWGISERLTGISFIPTLV